MKFPKAKILLASLFFILMLVIAGCSGQEAGSNSDSDNTGSETDSGGSTDGSGEENPETTLTFLVDNQTVLDGIEAVAAEIKEKYNITTEVELRPGGTEGDNLVKTRLATGEMTDLMWYNSGSLFKALGPEEYFVDLSGEAYMNQLDESYKETVSVGDQVFGIPGEAASAGGWLYNKKVYEELGLEVPKTWDELMENNEAIKNAGKVPVVASFKDTWTSQLIFLADYYNVHSQNPEFADQYTTNQAKISDTPLALRGFEKLQEVHEAGYFNTEESSTTYEDALGMLANGEAAHYPMLTFALPAIASNFPDKIDDIGFFGQPGDDADNHGITLWMPGSIYLNKESENIEAGKKWMEFFLSPEGLEIYLSVMNPQGPFVVKDVELPEDSFAAVKEMVPYLNEGKVAPALEFLSPLKGPSLEQITVEVALGMSDAAKGADSYDRDVVRQAKQLGLEGWD